jgi:proline iminopeptidase
MHTGDTELYVERFGSGPPLIAVHGGPGLGLEPFKPALPQLADCAEIILYDQRGCGRSAGGPPEMLCDIETHVADLEGLRASLGLDRITLLGHSFGAYLALTYALAHPRPVERMILVSPAQATPETPRQLHRWNSLLTPGMRREVAKITMQRMPPEEKANRRLRAVLPLYFHVEEGLRAFLKRDIRVSTIGELCGGSLMQHDLRPRLRELRMPVVIITGLEDKRTPPQYAADIAQHMPQAQVMEMPETGHFPFLERPEDFLRILRAILADGSVEA